MVVLFVADSNCFMLKSSTKFGISLVSSWLVKAHSPALLPYLPRATVIMFGLLAETPDTRQECQPLHRDAGVVAPAVGRPRQVVGRAWRNSVVTAPGSDPCRRVGRISIPVVQCSPPGG